jgi:hypothetical protein
MYHSYDNTMIILHLFLLNFHYIHIYSAHKQQSNVTKKNVCIILATEGHVAHSLDIFTDPKNKIPSLISL